VSPLWRNQLRILLGADRLVLSGYRRGLNPALVREESIPLQARPDARNDSAPWRAAVEALPGALVPSRAERPDVTVVLSNHFVRYALLPWNPALKTAEEWMALARHRMSAVHGDAVNDWLIRIAETTPQGPRIVSAVDKALIEELDDRFMGSGASLGSVQPFLMTAFNHIQPLLGNEACWFVTEDAGCMTVALMREGQWQAIGSRWVDERWSTCLPEILARKSAMLALEEPINEAIVCTRAQFDPGMHAMLNTRTVNYDRLAMMLQGSLQ